MATARSEDELKELVASVVSSDDPTLYEHACSVLAALLAFHGDGDLQCE